MLAEWRLDPVYIAENWTDEMLIIMVEKLVERKQRINEAAAGDGHSTSSDNMVSNEVLFAKMGKLVKVTKRGN